MSFGTQRGTEKSQSYTEKKQISVPLCATSAKLCVPLFGDKYSYFLPHQVVFASFYLMGGDGRIIETTCATMQRKKKFVYAYNFA